MPLSTSGPVWRKFCLCTLPLASGTQILATVIGSGSSGGNETGVAATPPSPTGAVPPGTADPAPEGTLSLRRRRAAEADCLDPEGEVDGPAALLEGASAEVGLGCSPKDKVSKLHDGKNDEQILDGPAAPSAARCRTPWTERLD